MAIKASNLSVCICYQQPIAAAKRLKKRRKCLANIKELNATHEQIENEAEYWKCATRSANARYSHAYWILSEYQFAMCGTMDVKQYVYRWKTE